MRLKRWLVDRSSRVDVANYEALNRARDRLDQEFRWFGAFDPRNRQEVEIPPHAPVDCDSVAQNLCGLSNPWKDLRVDAHE